MLTGLEVIAGVALWLTPQRESGIPASDSAPSAAASESARPRKSVLSAANPEVDQILSAWEKATIENRRTGCSFRRFRYDHEGQVEYRGEGEINVYRKGGWDYRVEPAKVPPRALGRKLAPGKVPFELREDFSERLQASRKKITIHVMTANGVKERSVPTFSDLFDWLAPLFPKDAEQPRHARPDDDRCIDISGLSLKHYGVTSSAAIVPTFLIGMRREEILKRFEVTLVETRFKNWIGLRFKPRSPITASTIGEARIMLNREGYVPEALLITNPNGNSEIVHLFRDWTIGEPAK